MRGWLLVPCLLLVPIMAHAEAPARRVSFRESARLAIGHAPVGLAVTELTAQTGWPDLVVVNDSSVSTFVNNRAGGFEAPHDLFVAPGLVGLALGQVDPEAYFEAVVSAPSSGAVFTLRGPGDGTFAVSDTLSGPWAPGALMLWSPDGASLPDLVVADLFFQAVVLATNNGSGAFSFQRQFGGFIDPVAMTIGYMDGNSFPDLVVADQVSRTVSVLHDFAQAGPVVRHDLQLEGKPVTIAVADLNGDGFMDVIVTTRDPGALVVLLGSADGTLHQAFTYPAGTDPCALVVADFDHDPWLDVAVVDRAANSIGMWLGAGDGSLVKAASIPTGAGPTALAAGQMNDDFWLDLVCANHDDGTVQVFLNTTSPQPGALRVLAPSPNPTASGCTLSFVLSAPAVVRIEIHDLTGRIVRRLVNSGEPYTGTYHIPWDGRTDHGDLARSGLYFARVRAGSSEATTRIVLAR